MLLFLHFGIYFLIASMEFRTAYIIQKNFVCMLFSDVLGGCTLLGCVSFFDVVDGHMLFYEVVVCCFMLF